MINITVRVLSNHARISVVMFVEKSDYKLQVKLALRIKKVNITIFNF